jgi:hypothetical protein
VYHILGIPAPDVQRAIRALPLDPLPPYGTPSALLPDEVLFDLDAALSAAAGWLDDLPRTTTTPHLLIAEMPQQPVTVPLRAIQGVSAAALHGERRRWIYPHILAFGQNLDDPQVGNYPRDCARFVHPFLAAGGRMVFSLHERAWDRTLYLNPNRPPGVLDAPGAHRFAALARYANEAGLDLTLHCTLDQRWTINHMVATQLIATYRVLLLHFDTSHVPSLRNALLRATIPHHMVPAQTSHMSAPDHSALILPIRHRGAHIVADWLNKEVSPAYLLDATAYLRTCLAHAPKLPAYTASP